ncbi:MAG: selenocysteine-specific translation elongation factor [Saccharofermentanales bacterium]|jgi:selenocysteine-specific elongation factor
MNHVIIGTAGHVDHGKSSLILALTDRDPDRLAEEKARGITIELGFTWLDLPDGARCGIIDVPGHEKFVSNMLAGAGGIDLALLVVAADEGVMPQTREHLGILSLLGIQRGVIAMTKVDLVDEEFAELVEDDIRDLVAGTFMENVPLVRTSAETGEGIEDLRRVLFDQIAQITRRREHLPFRLPVDRVFTLSGFGTIVTGTLIEGTIRTGDTVMIYPGEHEVRVRGIQIHEQEEALAEPGQRVALNLTGLKNIELSRGDTIAAPDSLRGSDRLDVELTALDDTRFPITNNMRVHFFHGAREMLGRVILLDRDVIEAGETAPAQIRAEETVYAKYGDHFVIRFFSPLETVGGGRIVDPLPIRRKRMRASNTRDFDVMAGNDPLERLALAIAHGAVHFEPLSTAFYRAGIAEKDARAMVDELVDRGTVIRLNDRIAIDRDALDAFAKQAVAILDRHHAKHPFEPGMRREEMRTRLLPRTDIQISDLVIDRLADADIIDVGQGLVSRRGFEVTLSEDQEKVVRQLESIFLSEGYSPPALEELRDTFGKRVQLDQLASLLIGRGTLVRLTPQILMHRDRVDQAWAVAREAIETEGSVTLADFRDRLRTTRKFAIALLEYFDKLKRTQLVDDARVFYN